MTQNPPTSGSLYGIAVPEMYHTPYPTIVGENGLILSSGGTINKWNQKYKLTKTLNSITDIAYENRIVIAVGESGTIITSPNCTTWTDKASGTVNSLHGVTYKRDNSQCLIVAVGENGTVQTSTEGTSWTTRNSGTHANLQAVTYNPLISLFIAVGDSGTILVSKNGIQWSRQKSPTKKCLKGVCHSYQQTIVAGDSGVIISSKDSTGWVIQNSGTKNDLNAIHCLFDLRAGTKKTRSGSPYFYMGRYFVAVGKNGTIVSSPDGIKWTVQTSGTQQNLNAISGVYNEFVVVGNRGTILTSKINYVNILPFEINQKNQDLVSRGSSVFYFQSGTRKTSLQIFNISGQRLKNFHDQEFENGLHIATLQSGLPGGKYLISLKTGPEKYNRVVTLP